MVISEFDHFGELNNFVYSGDLDHHFEISTISAIFKFGQILSTCKNNILKNLGHLSNSVKFDNLSLQNNFKFWSYYDISKAKTLWVTKQLSPFDQLWKKGGFSWLKLVDTLITFRNFLIWTVWIACEVPLSGQFQNLVFFLNFIHFVNYSYTLFCYPYYGSTFGQIKVRQFDLPIISS